MRKNSLKGLTQARLQFSAANRFSKPIQKGKPKMSQEKEKEKEEYVETTVEEDLDALLEAIASNSK